MLAYTELHSKTFAKSKSTQYYFNNENLKYETKLCVGKKNHLCERVTNIQLKDNAALREYAYE